MPLRDGVAVIIAAYNARDSIARAIRSALAQTPVREVLVCDDASPDDTAAVARAQDDGSGRLTVLTLPRNGGPAAARNAALAIAQAPYVCVLDSDDYLLPGRFERLLAGRGEDWDMLADDILIVPEGLAADGLSVAPNDPETDFTLDLATFVNANISRPGRPRAEWGFLKPLMARAFLTKHGLRYDEMLRLGEDYALYVRALMAGARFRVTGACGYVAIERGDSISTQHSAQDLKSILDFDERCLEEGFALSPAERHALTAHRRATQEKYDHRIVLDIRRRHGFAAALKALMRVPRSMPAILAETVRAKAAALSGQDRQSTREIRFVLGERAGSAVRWQPRQAAVPARA